MLLSLRMQVAARIREVLEEKGWTQQDLANESGLTKAYVSLLINGKLNLTLDTVDTLQKALGTQILAAQREAPP
jgi:transcriptional regulator with XRE-family HTH domain